MHPSLDIKQKAAIIKNKNKNKCVFKHTGLNKRVQKVQKAAGAKGETVTSSESEGEASIKWRPAAVWFLMCYRTELCCMN